MKTIEQHFQDWESDTFGYGYGTGEQYVLPVLGGFLAVCAGQPLSPKTLSYSHEAVSAFLGPVTTWFLINALCHAGVIEYGTSPRHGWLTPEGERLREFVLSKTNDELYDLVSGRTQDDCPCYRDYCNCIGKPGPVCPNPFWPNREVPHG